MKSSSLLPLPALVCALGLALPGLATAQTTVITFNEGSSTTSSFAGISTSNWSTGTGIQDVNGNTANGASLSTFSNPTAVYTTGVSPTGTNAVTVSTLVRGDWVNIGSGSGAFHLGFMTDTASNYTGTTSPGASTFALRLQSSGTTGAFNWLTRLNGTNGAITPTSGSTTVSGLNATNWYLVSATYSKSETVDLWNFTGSIIDYGTNGITPALAPLSEVSGSFSQTGTYNAATLYGAVNFRSGNTNPTYVDNFTVAAVPEPNTVASLGLASIGLILVARRARRKIA